MLVVNKLRKIRSLYYACVDEIVPFTSSRWALTAAISAIYAVNSRDIFADLNTYLVGFYLIMLLLSYFLPRGVSHDLDPPY